jgi:hypothetical protein
MNELPAELVAKMEAAKKASDKKCPTCGAGVGKWCEHRSDPLYNDDAPMVAPRIPVRVLPE